MLEWAKRSDPYPGLFRRAEKDRDFSLLQEEVRRYNLNPRIIEKPKEVYAS
jgi:hypothetical protein